MAVHRLQNKGQKCLLRKVNLTEKLEVNLLLSAYVVRRESNVFSLFTRGGGSTP